MMPTSADPSSVQYGSMIPQLTTHMSTLQLSTGGSVSILCNVVLVINVYLYTNFHKVYIYLFIFFYEHKNNCASTGCPKK